MLHQCLARTAPPTAGIDVQHLNMAVTVEVVVQYDITNDFFFRNGDKAGA